jgi:hypothetical protein
MMAQQAPQFHSLKRATPPCATSSAADGSDVLHSIIDSDRSDPGYDLESQGADPIDGSDGALSRTYSR